MTQWLSFAAKEMWDTSAVTRAIPKFNRPGDHAGAQALARTPSMFWKTISPVVISWLVVIQ